MEKYIVPIFFLSYLIFGCFILPDYGLSWDEPAQRNHGFVSADYINNCFDFGWNRQRKDQELETYKDRFYGVVFPLSGLFLERNLNLMSIYDAYLGRHYLVFLLFWLATVFMFKMLKMRFKDWRIALLGVLLLILSPRIFSHSFYNPKDIVLLSGVVISSYTLLRFIQFKNTRYALLHGIACAFVINTRIVGIIIPALTISFFFLEILQNYYNQSKKQNGFNLLKVFSIFCITFCSLTIVLWPFLWTAPLKRLQEAFQHMGAYPWAGDNFLFGKWIKGTENPWYYTLAWLVATTPALYTILGLFGIYLVCKNTLKNLFVNHFVYADNNQRIDLFWFGLFSGALFIVAWKQSVLYNGWRQMYFIYPSFLSLTLVGIHFIFEKIKALETSKKQIRLLFFTGIIFMQIATTTFFMIKYHPWQHVYFSIFAGKNKIERFEIDYWGTSYKQALEKIYELDNREGRIKIAALNYPGRINVYFLETKMERKLKFVDSINEADYYLTNYYGKTEFNKFKNKEFPFNQEPYFEFTVEGNPFMSVFKLKTQNK